MSRSGLAVSSRMTVEDAIRIDAPPDLVWRVTVDVERWPEWTPTVTSVARVGRASLGRGSVVRIKQPGQPESEWTVTEFEPRERFAWASTRPGMQMVATHEMAPDGAGTKNVLRVAARGPLAVFLWPLLRFFVRRALSSENGGLKTYCEQSS